MNIKALTRGRTDYFAAGVTYLQFEIQVTFSAMLSGLVLLSSISVTVEKKKHFFL